MVFFGCNIAVGGQKNKKNKSRSMMAHMHLSCCRHDSSLWQVRGLQSFHGMFSLGSPLLALRLRKKKEKKLNYKENLKKTKHKHELNSKKLTIAKWLQGGNVQFDMGWIGCRERIKERINPCRLPNVWVFFFQDHQDNQTYIQANRKAEKHANRKSSSSPPRS